MNHIYAFIKLVDDISHANDFINGKIRFNTIRSFKEYKDSNGELRGDTYEGVVTILQPEKTGSLKLGNITIPSSDIAGPILIHNNQILDNHVFCLYALNNKDINSVSKENINEYRRMLDIHHKSFGLGKHCVVIHQPKSFIERCQKRIKFQGNMTAVDYYNEKIHHGDLPPEKWGFQKREKFKHQNEYRIKIDVFPKTSSPHIVDIGNINDIAFITTPTEFNKKLEISLPDGTKA